MEVDTGAAQSTLAMGHWKRLLPQAPLSPSTLTLRNFDGTPIRLLGTIPTTLAFGGWTCSDIFHIVPDSEPTVLGKNFLTPLKMIIDCGQQQVKTMAATLPPTTPGDPLSGFPRLLSKELGTFPDFQHKIRIQPGTAPHPVGKEAGSHSGNRQHGRSRHLGTIRLLRMGSPNGYRHERRRGSPDYDRSEGPQPRRHPRKVPPPPHEGPLHPAGGLHGILQTGLEERILPHPPPSRVQGPHYHPHTSRTSEILKTPHLPHGQRLSLPEKDPPDACQLPRHAGVCIRHHRPREDKGRTWQEPEAGAGMPTSSRPMDSTIQVCLRGERDHSLWDLPRPGKPQTDPRLASSPRCEGCAALSGDDNLLP